MRIRNVKPEFYRSDDTDKLSWEERYFFIALFTYVDDNGVGRDRESDICADLFAGDFSVDPGETLRKVRHCLLVLVRGGLVVRYKVEGKPFLFVTGWDKHQYVKNPNRERYPRPSDVALRTSSVEAGEILRTSSVDVPSKDLETCSDKGLLTSSVHPPETLPTVVGSKSLVVGSKNIIKTPDRFDEFWDIYPKKVAKTAAKRKWDTLVKTVDPDQIISGAKVYARSVRDSEARFIKQPDGWLNAGRWEDDLAEVKEYDELGFLL